MAIRAHTPERMGRVLEALGGWIVSDLPGGITEVRETIDPLLDSVLDRLRPVHDTAIWTIVEGYALDRSVEVPFAAIRYDVRMARWPAGATEKARRDAPAIAVCEL
jgi:hypothetical protein